MMIQYLETISDKVIKDMEDDAADELNSDNYDFKDPIDDDKAEEALYKSIKKAIEENDEDLFNRAYKFQLENYEDDNIMDYNFGKDRLDPLQYAIERNAWDIIEYILHEELNLENKTIKYNLSILEQMIKQEAPKYIELKLIDLMRFL